MPVTKTFQNNFLFRRNQMKYIIFEDFAGKKAPILFPERILHQEIWDQLPYSKLCSAGFVYQEKKGFVCSGGCKELDAEKVAGDEQIIADFFCKT
jgi:hypothetical protein